MDNAIPRSTRALLCVSSEETDKLEEKLREIDSVYKREYASADPDITGPFSEVWRGDRQSPHSEERVSSSVSCFTMRQTA